MSSITPMAAGIAGGVVLIIIIVLLVVIRKRRGGSGGKSTVRFDKNALPRPDTTSSSFSSYYGLIHEANFEVGL